MEEYVGCHLCGQELLPYRDALWCVICDNTPTCDATWFELFKQTEA